MKLKLIIAARVVLGLAFFVFGLNGFLHFIPQPPISGPPGEFLGAMIATGYLFSLLKVTEVVCGALLLAGRFVPLALTMLAPVLVNIVFFHAFLEPGMIGLPLVLTAIEIYLAWVYRGAFRPMLQARVTPDDAQPVVERRPATA